jgi:hypothetical protein
VDVYLYLSMLPESLVASMLPPEQFGAYLATGTLKRPHGRALFFDLKPGFQSSHFNLADVAQRCVPHADGQPKHSVYLGIYRVLEHVPLEALGSLWLTTTHGRVLQLEPSRAPSSPSGPYHLYQEICPVHPLIASSLAAQDFAAFITDPSRPISVPRICFVELELGDLASDPREGSASGLPYHNAQHLRDCLVELGPGTGKHTKTVDRVWRQDLLYRCVKGGFFVGDREAVLFYAYPTHDELERQYYAWWHCANDAEIAATP